MLRYIVVYVIAVTAAVTQAANIRAASNSSIPFPTLLFSSASGEQSDVFGVPTTHSNGTILPGVTGFANSTGSVSTSAWNTTSHTNTGRITSTKSSQTRGGRTKSESSETDGSSSRTRSDSTDSPSESSSRHSGSSGSSESSSSSRAEGVFMTVAPLGAIGAAFAFLL